MDSAIHFMRDMRNLMDRHISSVHYSQTALEHHDQLLPGHLLHVAADQRKDFIRTLNMRTRILDNLQMEERLNAFSMVYENESLLGSYLKHERELLEEHDRILGRAYLAGPLKELMMSQRNAISELIQVIEPFEQVTEDIAQ